MGMGGKLLPRIMYVCTSVIGFYAHTLKHDSFSWHLDIQTILGHGEDAISLLFWEQWVWFPESSIPLLENQPHQNVHVVSVIDQFLINVFIDVYHHQQFIGLANLTLYQPTLQPPTQSSTAKGTITPLPSTASTHNPQ